MPPRRKRQKKVEQEDEEEIAEVKINPTSMTVVQLRAELNKRGLETGGKKAELVQRLKDALDEDEPGPSKKVRCYHSNIMILLLVRLKRSLKKRSMQAKMMMKN